MNRPWLWLLAPILVLAAMIGVSALARSMTPATPEAEAYLHEAIGILKNGHINRDKVDWAKIEAQAEADIRGAKQPSDTYAAIGRVIGALGEKHSGLIPPVAIQSPQEKAITDEPIKLPEARLEDGSIGILRIPHLNTVAHPDRGEPFAQTLKKEVQSLDAKPLCGWIVDLRGNDGGNMWPMLAGIAPLLGAEPYGYFVPPHAQPQPWLGSMAQASASMTDAPAVHLRHADAPLAVLLDSGTASSGEMVAIALIGRPGVRTFGQTTAGYTTANMPIRLSDGAILLLTGSYVRDRTGRNYTASIEPDVSVAPAAAVATAASWLKQQCRNPGGA